jgi:hypothetical protein
MNNRHYNLNYFFKKTLVLLLIFSFSFLDILSVLPNQWQKTELLNKIKINEVKAAALGDGVFIYDQTTPTTNVQSRLWDNATSAVGTASSPFAGSGVSKHIYIKGNPVRQEMMMGIQDAAGLLTIYISDDAGLSWTSQWTATIGDGNLKRFEIAYEQNSGNAIVIYSANVGTTNEIKYQIWNGSSWSGALNLDPIRTSGTIYGIRAAERSGSDEVGIVWVDTNNQMSTNLWTGSAWYGEPTAALVSGTYTTIARSGGATPSTVPTRRGYDIIFESLSGDLMVVWGNDSLSTTQVDPRYIIKTAGGAWGAAAGTAITNLTEDGEMIDISSSPISDKIALSTCSIDTGADCNSIVWSGTAWGTVVSDTTSAAAITGESSNNVEWLVDGTNEVAVITYSDASGGGIDWYTSVNGATPVVQTDNSTAPAIAGLERAGFAKVNPADSREGVFIFEDANADIFVKRAYLTGTTVAWSNPTGLSAAIETNASVTGFNPVGFAFNKFVPPVPAVTVSSIGTQTANLNSSDTGQYVGAAFTLSQDQGAAQNITGLTVTGIGTASGNTTLSNVLLRYENVASPDTNCVYNGTETATAAVSFDATDKAVFTGLNIPLAVGTDYTCLYVVLDLAKSGVYPVGGQTIEPQITASTDITFSGDATKSGTFPVALSGTTTIRPKITSYTNSTETALNYTASCTDCGARIGPGSPYRQTIVISGYGFGTDPGLGSRDTATNKVEIVGAATDALIDDGSANTNVSAWSNTSITIRTDSNIAGNTDTDLGTNYGGANALQVTAGGQATATDLNFYLFPQVTSITVPTATANAAREYNASDSDGVITLNGTRFGSSATGGWVRIFGCDSATCSSPTGSATTNSWGSTAVAVQVPAVIADNIYTGSVVMQQGGGTANKSHTYTTTGFRILPRLTSLSPTSGVVGAAITVNGNHLCQNNAVCPSAYDTNNRVTFTSAINSTVFTSWSNTAIVTAVPTNSVDGVVYLMSNAYQSNNSSAFSVLTPAPNNPTALNQFKNVALTSALAVGDISSSTNTYFTSIMSADFAGGTLYQQIEYQPVGTPFACTGTGACGTASEGAGKAGPGPIDCSVSANACAITAAPADGVYHWQARTRHFYSGSNYYSSWVSFGGNGESATDFQVDKTGPVITFSGANTCADAVSSLLTNSANISWSLNESATGQIEYSKNSNLSASVTYPSTPNPTAFSHSFPLNNLDSNTTYYFRVKSVDAAGNITLRPTNSPYCSFTTGNVTQPAKTTKFYVGSVAGLLTGGAATSSDFSVYVPENSVSVKNAFIELTGFSPNSGTNNVAISINNQATSTYSIASNGNSFKVLYPVSGANLNFDPIGNTFNINPSLDTNITSAELVLTYSFAP